MSKVPVTLVELFSSFKISKQDENTLTLSYFMTIVLEHFYPPNGAFTSCIEAYKTWSAFLSVHAQILIPFFKKQQNARNVIDEIGLNLSEIVASYDDFYNLEYQKSKDQFKLSKFYTDRVALFENKIGPNSSNDIEKLRELYIGLSDEDTCCQF